MSEATRTVNPLHFEDLEPHRFEDLVRQLIYDFRDWYRLEAGGRSGKDGGVDIRGIERVVEPVEVLDEEDSTVVARDSSVTEHLWIIQCKRHQNMGPRRVEQVIMADLSWRASPPYGYILVASCDFSDATRGRFFRLTANFGVQESYIFGKAELEDMLFRPENDHLLFAYFGISLKVRRRSARTRVRSNITLKRALIKHLGELHSDLSQQVILIRDPADLDYPFIDSPDEFNKSPKWRYWYFAGHKPPDHVAFVQRKCYAYLDQEAGEFDMLSDYDAGLPTHPYLFGLPEEAHREVQAEEYHSIWYGEIPERFRAWYYEISTIPYERVLAIDDLGDGFNAGPHLLVDFLKPGDPFNNFMYTVVRAVSNNGKSFSANSLVRSNHLRSLRNMLQRQREKLSNNEWHERILDEMRRVRKQFLNATINHITEWYWSFTVLKVTGEAETTKAISKEQLAELKAKVRELQEQTENTVIEFLSPEKLWWDMYTADQTYGFYGYRPPVDIDKAIRLTAGKLGPILKNFGYLDSQADWREYDRSGNYHPPNARPYYPYSYEWSSKMRTLIEKYESLRLRFLSIARISDSLHGESKSIHEELKELWDSV
jgi:hypothetical protein